MQWWWLLLLVPVGVAGFLALRRRAADAELLREHRERSVAERAEIVVRPRGHAPLQEPTTAGEATALVERFVAAVRAVPNEERARVRVADDADTEAWGDAAAVLGAHPEPLARLANLLTVPSTPPAPRFDMLEAGDREERIAEAARWLEVAARLAVRDPGAERAVDLPLLELALGCEIAWACHTVDDLVGSRLQRSGIQHLAVALARTPLEADAARRLRDVVSRVSAARVPEADVLAVECASLRRMLLDEARGWSDDETGLVRLPA